MSCRVQKPETDQTTCTNDVKIKTFIKKNNYYCLAIKETGLSKASSMDFIKVQVCVKASCSWMMGVQHPRPTLDCPAIGIIASCAGTTNADLPFC